jgi:hypothetical protein
MTACSRAAGRRCTAELPSDEPERAAAEPEVIAHHFTEAGLDDLAMERRARRAIRLCAAPRSRRRSRFSRR